MTQPSPPPRADRHPPWLRFQAYVVGLPKTGSTSVAGVFGHYRSGHEWQRERLTSAGLARQRGELTDAQFFDATGDRLLPPTLEMDSVTVHHLYADLLRDTFPTAVFVHTVRDVRSWVTSLLDMMLRKRRARRYVDIPITAQEVEYAESLTKGAFTLDPACSTDDSISVVPLLEYWAHHMSAMHDLLPPERSISLPTNQIGARLDDLAALVGMPAGTLLPSLAHANRSPASFDRLGAYDSAELRDAYDEHCAALMAEYFPDEHRAWESGRLSGAPSSTSWAEHVAEVDAWVAASVRDHRGTAAR